MTDFTASHTRAARTFAPRAPRTPGLSYLLGLWRQRRALAALEDHQLADIGLSRAQAEDEANRPIWDVPQNWRA